MSQIFEFTDYKSYLKKRFRQLYSQQKGVRTRFSEAIQVRSGYVTQVLDGSSHLSLEQTDLASTFLGHTEEEDEYFRLMVLFARAGTKTLKEKIGRQLERSREQHHNLKSRFKVESISQENQTLFYSNWQYVAVLAMLSVPSLQTKEAISSHLNLSLKRISEILNDLEKMGLASQEKGRFTPLTFRTHLGKESPLLAKHHINWRMQSIKSIENQDSDNLHYSSVVSLSQEDMYVVKERLTQALEEVAKIIAPSKEEKVLSLCLDFFKV